MKNATRTKAAPPTHAATHGDARGAFIRTRPCCSCGAEPSKLAGIAAAFIALAPKQEWSDEQRVPLCKVCRPQWNLRAGKFAGWSDEYRYQLGTSWVHATLARFEAAKLVAAAADIEAQVARRAA